LPGLVAFSLINIDMMQRYLPQFRSSLRIAP